MSLVSTVTSLQACIEQSSDSVFCSYLKTLREDPPAVAAWFRRLYNARTRRGRNTDIELCQLCECLARTHELRKSREELQLPEELGFLRAGGVALIVSAGLPKAYIDVLGEHGFLDEDPRWMRNIVTSLADLVSMCVSQNCRNATLTDVLLNRSDAMWEALWAGRRALVRGVDVLAEENMREVLTGLIWVYHQLYIIRKWATPLDSTRASWFIFFIWYHATPAQLILCLNALYFFISPCRVQSAEAQKWTRCAVVREFGAEKTLERFNRDLEDPNLLDGPLFFLIHMLCVVLEHQEMEQVFLRGRTVKSLAIAVRRQADVGKFEFEAQVLPAALPFIQDAVEHNDVSACLAPMIQYYDLFKIIADGVKMSVVINKCSSSDLRVCMSLIETTYRLLADPSTPKGKTRMRHALKRAAREEWLNTLFALQKNNPSDPMVLPLFHRLVIAWERLGQEAGVSLASERERYTKLEERQEMHMCYNKACEFHYSKTSPPHLMMKCKGCRLTQYCDRACQKNNWYNGGHRDICKGEQEQN